MIAYIEAQGGLLIMRVRGQKSRQRRGGGVRGRIRSFSAQSRRRILRFMARMKTVGVRATFITLTFKGYPTNAQAKAALKRFLMRVFRRSPSSAGIWRMEYQGRGSIHFHLLFFRLAFWEQSEIQRVWTECTREKTSRVDIRLVRSKRGVMHYVSKYIAKRPERGRKASLVSVPYQHASRKWRKGRFWGYHNAKHLPLGQKYTGVLVDEGIIKRLSSFAWGVIGSDNQYDNLSFHLFWDAALLLCHNCVEEGGLSMDEWRDSSQVSAKDYANWEWIDKHFPAAHHEKIVAQPITVKSRPSEASTIQPLLSRWLSKASRSVRGGSISDCAIGCTIVSNSP